MLANAPVSLSGIAGKENGNRVKLWPGEAADPIIRMVRAGVAESLPPGCHALPEFFRECGKRRLVKSECAQSIPGERHRYPASFQVDCTSNRFCRRHFFPYGFEPGAPLGGLTKRKKFISPGQRRHARH